MPLFPLSGESIWKIVIFYKNMLFMLICNQFIILNKLINKFWVNFTYTHTHPHSYISVTPVNNNSFQGPRQLLQV